MNRSLLTLFLLFLGLSLFCAILGSIKHVQNSAIKNWYLGIPAHRNFIYNFLLLFGSYLVLYSVIIPISLYVSMVMGVAITTEINPKEIVKLTQTWLIDQDLDMYDEENDVIAHASTSNLTEALG